jgi:hypothetical protein
MTAIKIAVDWAGIVTKLEAQAPKPLRRGAGPRACNMVYVLYWKGELVYVGKVTGMHLKARLAQHLLKLKSRKFRFDELTYRYLAFKEAWAAIGAEHFLIQKYNPNWNKSGFGYRPGTENTRRREKPCTWDVLFPKPKRKKRGKTPLMLCDREPRLLLTFPGSSYPPSHPQATPTSFYV